MPSHRAHFPAALAIAFISFGVLSMSPNFQFEEGVREAPYGGDALQEWLGSRIARTNPDQLYDLDYVIELQRDASYVGYASNPERYFPMVYPPFYYVALRPLSYLTAYQAALVQFSFVALCALGCVWLASLVPVANRASRELPMVLLAAALFVPLTKSLGMAQKSAVLLLLFLGSYELLRRGHKVCSGAVAGLLAFKPHILLLAILIFAFQREWKWLKGCMVSIAVLALLCLPTGIATCFDYAEFARNSGKYIQTNGYALAESHSLQGFFAMLFSTDSAFAGITTLVSGIAVVAVVLFAVRRSERKSRAEIMFSTVCLATPLVSPHFYTYDLTILLLPMLLLWKLSFESERFASFRWLAAAIWAAGFASAAVAEKIGIQISVVVMCVALATIAWRLGQEQSSKRSSSRGLGQELETKLRFSPR